MSLAVKTGPAADTDDEIQLKRGAKTIIFLFLLTIATAVYFHNFLHLPSVLSMFMGLGYLQFYGYYLKQTFSTAYLSRKYNIPQDEIEENTRTGPITPFNAFVNVSRAEWDTLLFLYGGVMSAVADNIPVMFAVLKMNPDMSPGHWLLVTLTAGVGGSLLSIGSAAGVAGLDGAVKRCLFLRRPSGLGAGYCYWLCVQCGSAYLVECGVVLISTLRRNFCVHKAPASARFENHSEGRLSNQVAITYAVLDRRSGEIYTSVCNACSNGQHQASSNV